MKLVAGEWRLPVRPLENRQRDAMPEDLTHIAGPSEAALLRAERRPRAPAGFPVRARPDH
jgi:hypothetical protein